MAIVLEFDGNDDYAVFNSNIDITGDFRILIEGFKYISLSLSAGDFNAITGGLDFNNFLPCHKGGNWQGRLNGADVNYLGLDVPITTNAGTYEFERVGVIGTLTVNGQSKSLTVNGGTFKIAVFAVLNANSPGATHFGNIRFSKVSIFNSSGILIHSYDASSSVHTAGTPILTDTIGGNNATGVNMPTAALGQPGSAWIDLGGGGISVTVDSTMPSMTSDGVFTQEQPLAILSASITSVMPSMASTANFTQSVPEFNGSISSSMPSMLSSASFTQSTPLNGASISSTMPSMVSASLFGHTVPEFDNTIDSTMPSMVSSASIQNLVPGNNTAIASLMPSMVSSASFTIEDPITLDAAINSFMPSMSSSSTFFNGILSIVIGEGNNIDIVVKSRNVDSLTESRNINIKTKSRNI